MAQSSCRMAPLRPLSSLLNWGIHFLNRTTEGLPIKPHSYWIIHWAPHSITFHHMLCILISIPTEKGSITRVRKSSSVQASLAFAFPSLPFPSPSSSSNPSPQMFTLSHPNQTNSTLLKMFSSHSPSANTRAWLFLLCSLISRETYSNSNQLCLAFQDKPLGRTKSSWLPSPSFRRDTPGKIRVSLGC